MIPFRSVIREQPWTWWLGQGVLYVLLWASLMKLPVSPSIDLDPSWQMALGYAANEGLQHGRDIVFTYGPLGYFFRASTYMGELFGVFMAWQVVSNLVIAAGLFLFGRGLTGWRQAGYYAYLFWFGSAYGDAMHMNFITIFSLMLMQSGYRHRGWIVAAVAIFAVLSLVKFTNLMLCLVVVGVLAAFFVITRRRHDALLLAGGFVVSFLLGWMAFGQGIGNLPSFLYYGLQLSTGYVGAMGVYETTTTFVLGLSAAGCVAIYAVLHFFSNPDRIRALCSIAILGAVIFLNWKHGFVRADGHVLGHYVMVLLVICCHPALIQDPPRWGRAKNGVLAAGLAICLTGIGRFHLSTAIEAPSIWNYRLRDTFAAVFNPAEFHARLQHQLSNTAATVPIPTIKGFVGRETVDHLGADQAVTILNGLNYTPRPAIQGYTTYTEPLNRLDADFYRSDRGPRFVVQRYQSIDERLIALDDSHTLKLLFQNYDYTLEDAGLILWERPPVISEPDPADEPVLLTRTVRFDETVDVPVTDRPLWAEINIHRNLAGRIRQFLYKPPTVHIEIRDDRGDQHRYLFIPAMGEAGFILQPLFTDGAELIAYHAGQAPRQVRQFTLRVMPGGENYFQDDIAIELKALAPFTRGGRDIPVTSPHRLRMMNRTPSRLSAAAPVTNAFVDGRHLLQMHPSSVIEFRIDEPITSIRAAFGIMDGAYTGPEGTLGVEFIVEWRDHEGNTERLFSRLLDPVNRTDDRPMQTLELSIGPRSNGLLILRTEPGPTRIAAYGWAYWTDIEIK